MSRERRERITFKATKIVSKPAKVTFQTKKGETVEFKAQKFVPKKVKVEFLVKRKNK